METGHRTSTSPHSSTPSFKHLAWVALAGTALVISGTRGQEPPQPSAAQAFTAPVRPAPARTGPAAPHVAQLSGPRPTGRISCRRAWSPEA
ncbi:hypothetical protein NKH18_03295 [Streptomyces sp. M10(2022)]